MKTAKVKGYEFKLSHDKGTVTQTTYATSKERALFNVLSRENAPRRAVKFVRWYPLLEIDWTRINNDVNGNPRYVCHWLNIPGANSYEEALKKARTIGGRKFHNKQYGGGIVFQSYNIQDETRAISAL